MSHEEGEGAASIRDLRYRAALGTDDLESADALLGGALSPTLHHVWLRYDAGRHPEALALLDRLDESSAATDRAGLLRVVLLGELGRLDEALAAVNGDASASGEALI